ncbi:OPT family small oligopeptide transporter [Kalaharituber pfeilii]|nr:OPT family small oligopeptide transporter [Kalaharituber pfeilii]
MTTALLRSPPAVGTGSYGALPTLPGRQGYDSSIDESLDSSLEEAGDDIDERSGSSSPGDGQDIGYGIGRATHQKLRRSFVYEEMLGPSRRIGSSDGRVRDSRVISMESEADGDETDNDTEIDEEDPPDNSPYPEVRASVVAVDDITLSINTPRMWFLSILFSLIGSSTNLFFSLRYPSISITPVIALLLAHPLGLLWDGVFCDQGDPNSPDVNKPLSPAELAAASKWTKLRRWLGQGRWNRKEHSCVYISSNVSFGFAFATDVIVEQTHFYHQNPGIIYQLLLTLSTQILGYTFAGLTRQWLVYPSGMIWPSTLMSTSMFTTLHGEENKPANGWKITRWKFFIFVFLGSFFWYFLPGLIAPFLSYFNILTWMAPKNVVVANLFGVSSGLGLFPVTFDWAQISYIGSPLMTPFWAAANVVAGLTVVMWILAPVLYYSGALFGSYMPMLSSVVFDNTGKPYDVSKILTKDFLFDEEAYKNYSKVFMPITYVLSYGLQFAALTALVSHTICWHGKDIVRQWKRSRKEARVRRTEATNTAYAPIGNTASTPRFNPALLEAYKRRRRLREHGSGSSGHGVGRNRRRTSIDERALGELMDGEDVHMRLMRRYNEAPTSWYFMTFGVMLVVGIFVVEYYPVHLPWYGLLLALGICGVFFVPIGIVMAITNQQSSLFLICQLICGSVFPGRPVANMVFVTYGYITSTQGLKFSADLKLGHYMKIPPRLLFVVQMVATIVSSLTQIAVLNWMFANVPRICTPEAVSGFTCPIARVHFNGSILWGVVGPGKFFGKGAIYRPLIWAFVIGAAAPVGIWLLARNTKRKSLWRKINLPVVFGSLSWIPPATGLNFSSWAIVCYCFNHVIRRRATAWWGKYTMTLSAALDAGLAFSLVVVFFGFIYPGWMDGFSWWGTEIYKQGCDWQACPLTTVPEGGHFGPDK